MYGKIQITGKMEVITGLHIGGSSAFSAIGAVDSPVIRDSVTNLPIIPGSSLKGKLRTLLAKQYNEKLATSPEEDCEEIIRLFGTSKKNAESRIPRGRLLFTDMILDNSEELYKQGVPNLTEVKFENSINRLTAVANPRQIERVIRGSVFPVDIVYEINDDGIERDFQVLCDGFRLLTYDYLGGNGSRGYGKVKFSGLKAKIITGNVDETIVDACNKCFSEL